MKDILPSMPKGEIVGDMAIAEMTQMVKVVIDGNRLVMEHAQVLEHKCWYTDAETQKLNHRCWNTDVGMQMLKHRRRRLSRLLVMAIGWLWSTHKRCWNIEAETQSQMLAHSY